MLGPLAADPLLGASSSPLHLCPGLPCSPAPYRPPSTPARAGHTRPARTSRGAGAPGQAGDVGAHIWSRQTFPSTFGTRTAPSDHASPCSGVPSREAGPACPACALHPVVYIFVPTPLLAGVISQVAGGHLPVQGGFPRQHQPLPSCPGRACAARGSLCKRPRWSHFTDLKTEAWSGQVWPGSHGAGDRAALSRTWARSSHLPAQLRDRSWLDFRSHTSSGCCFVGKVLKANGY